MSWDTLIVKQSWGGNSVMLPVKDEEPFGLTTKETPQHCYRFLSILTLRRDWVIIYSRI
jgi:hypothetical protein